MRNNQDFFRHLNWSGHILANFPAIRGESDHPSYVNMENAYIAHQYLPRIMQLILYTKPGCHLCEGLHEKLQVIRKRPQRTCDFTLEIRDIMTRDDWFQLYHYEVPILTLLVETELDGVINQEEKLIPRMSPRLTVDQVEETLCKYL